MLLKAVAYYVQNECAIAENVSLYPEIVIVSGYHHRNLIVYLIVMEQLR
jgi:hypothetical protein